VGLIAHPNLAPRSNKVELYLYRLSGPTWLVLRRPLPLPYLYNANKTAVCTFRSRQSPWPRGLTCGSAVSRLLGLLVRIPTGVWMSVSCDCCVLSDRGLYDGPISYPETPTECDRESSIMKRPWHTEGCGALGWGEGGGKSSVYGSTQSVVQNFTGPSYGQQHNFLQYCQMVHVCCSVGNNLSFHLSTKRHLQTASNLMFC
jgi:hypothetical protein